MVFFSAVNATNPRALGDSLTAHERSAISETVLRPRAARWGGESRARARRDALTQQQPGIDHAHDTDSRSK